MKPLPRLLEAATVARWSQALASTGRTAQPLVNLPLPADEVLRCIAASAAAPELETALGPAPWCNLSQSWLRHGRPPHGWHQDGALRFDFLAHASPRAPADALLELRTLWIALTPCGEHAPSLAWVAAATPELLQPAALTDAAVLRRFGAATRHCAVLDAGDALLFDGALLHRTHLTPAMDRPRLSLELRFFRTGALPARVAGDVGAVWTTDVAGRHGGASH
ncbi:MAG: hypothetical protein JNM33_13695 [Rubrivivax sp.]|nr:hypothetical protein [Rubrivivax sp.]